VSFVAVKDAQTEFTRKHLTKRHLKSIEQVIRSSVCVCVVLKGSCDLSYIDINQFTL